jgi:hypothetical protein
VFAHANSGPPNRQFCRQLLRTGMKHADIRVIVDRFDARAYRSSGGQDHQKGFPTSRAPKSVIRLRLDQAIRLATQADMMDNVGGADAVWINAGRSVMWTHPKELTAGLIDFASGGGYRKR